MQRIQKEAEAKAANALAEVQKVRAHTLLSLISHQSRLQFTFLCARVMT